MKTDEAFAILEQAAVTGSRCPQNAPHGPLPHGATSALARDGKIRIEVFVHNWRVITILTGPHAGKQTAKEPGWSTRPYSATDARGTCVNGKFIDKGPKRIGPSAPRDLAKAVRA